MNLPNIPGNELLRVEVGSTLHGIDIGSDDTDLMGITIEPWESTFGLERFEQFEYRTAAKGERSGSGDIDLVSYGLRKWMRLAVQGNPSVIMLLYAPDNFIHFIDKPFGQDLLNLRSEIVSERTKDRFLGYLNGQRQRALKGSGTGHGLRENRQEKWASHMVRLGFQCLELLETGILTLPMDEGQAEQCREIKRGNISFENALKIAEDLEHQIENMTANALRKEPNLDVIQEWMRDAYLFFTDR